MSRQNVKFIAFEGIDGSGKSKQCELLSQYLDQYHIAHIVTREPGGTAFGEDIRNIFLHNNAKNLHHYEEILLLLAARHHHFQTKIIPAFEQNKWVLCDRYHLSTYAYQAYIPYMQQPSYKEDMLQHYIKTIDHIADIIFDGENFMPDINFICDISIDDAEKRFDTRIDGKTRFENQDKQWRQNLRIAFQQIHQHHNISSHLIDASQNIDLVHRDIISYIRKWLP